MWIALQVVPQKKKPKGPPKVAAAQAVEPSEDDEFEQLGRGVTYTDVWKLSTRDYSWARVSTTGQVILHFPVLPSRHVILSAMRTNQKAEEKSAVQERHESVFHTSPAPTAHDVLYS